MNRPIPPDVALKWLLRLIGGVELCAIPFLLFPFPWMNVVHDRALGLGPLPSAPVVEYMARSLSALYAVHGAIVFRLSFDVVRFRPLIGFLGWLHLALGLVVVAIDFSAGLPWWWIAVEGPGIAAGGVLVLVLNYQANSAGPDPKSGTK
jgi:hypothetical protein